jgi:hypothetical protein
LQFDNAGRFWVVWLDSIGQFAEFDRVRARSVSALGELGPILDLVDTSDIPFTPALFPRIVPTDEPKGDFFLFYSRYSSDGLVRVYGQRVSPSGVLVGELFAASPPPPAAALGTAVSRKPQGGFFLLTALWRCVVCQNTRFDLNVRVLGVDGKPETPNVPLQRGRGTGGVQGARSLTVDGQGNAVAVWGGIDDRDIRDSSDVYGRRFSSSGQPIGSRFRVNTTIRGTQAGPSVAADEDGDFVVVWQNRFPGGLLRSIFGQRFSKTGKKVGPEFRVNEERIEKDFQPLVAMDREGNFVVVWQSFSNSPDRAQCGQVRLRLYRRDGTPTGPEFPAAPGYAACGDAPKVAFGPDGVFAVVWSVEKGFSPETGTDFDVYAARFSVSPALP